MSQELPTTSFALLGLLSLGDALTGYELKQRADNTLRFYWVSPAMSQVYTELTRLSRLRLIKGADTRRPGHRRTPRRYRITAKGTRTLKSWLETAPADFPVLKHPVALRLLLGHLVDPERTITMLEEYVESLAARSKDLHQVRDSLAGADAVGQPYHYPSLVADWGLDYYAAETETVQRLIERLHHE